MEEIKRGRVLSKKNLILFSVLIISSILIINAGNVIVKEGQLNVSENFHVGVNDFFVNTTI